jgi:ketosteroid isomerase-like protein
MSSVDPMAAAIDWLDAYRAASLSIVDLYATDAVLACDCDGPKTIQGHAAITEYWRQRFVEKPADELVDLQVDGEAIVVSFKVHADSVQATLHFDSDGKIRRSICNPRPNA